ncbi:MAG TPA: hypothetical protein VGG79_03190 [Roseiarcus sp.]|jgi:uncharacterized protein YecT (DUF1311 family)
MTKLWFASMLVLGWAFVPGPAFAEAKCPAGDAPIFEDDLRAAPSCEAAHKLHDACAWGSSGDARLSGAVIEKCEAMFLDRLTPAQKRNYEARQQRCSDKYSREDGSLAIAETALCAEAIAVSFARNAAAAGRTPAAPLAPVKASFDCGKARTELELLICSGDVIGAEDIDLSQAYREALRRSAPDLRKVLVASESGWLAHVAKSCISEAIGRDASKLCAEQAFSDRVDQLNRCMSKSGDEEKACLNVYAPVVDGATQR